MPLSQSRLAGDNGALDESAIFGALYACAANPENWDQLISVLKSEVPTTGDIDSLQQAFADRLTRAEDLAWRLSEPDRVSAQSPLPPMPFAYLALGDSRRVLGFNDLFARQLSPVLGQLVRGGRLKIESSENDDALTDATRRLTRTASGRTALHLKDATGDSWHVGYLAKASALPAPVRRALGPDLGSDLAAHVLLFPGEATQRLALDVVQKGLGLTPAEARLAIRLKDGLSISEAAEALGISVNTARNQLRSIFQKIGVNRQSELVRSLTQLSTFATRIWFDEADDAPPQGSVKAPDIQLMKLRHGRRLAFRSYGPDSGRPILFFHEGLGSSLLRPETLIESVQRHMRVLSVERPGFGLSDPSPNYSFEAVAADIVEFLDHLKIDRVALVGTLSGAAHALATATRLGPRATRVVLCSGRPPIGPAPAIRSATDLIKNFRRRLSTHPWLVDTFFTIMRARVSPSIMQRLLRSAAASAPDDVAYLDQHPEAYDFMAAYVGESMAVSARGVSDELRCFGRGDSIDLTGLNCPVIAYHGDRDSIAPVEDVRAYLDQIPGAELPVVSGAGHLLAMRIGSTLADAALA